MTNVKRWGGCNEMLVNFADGRGWFLWRGHFSDAVDV